MRLLAQTTFPDAPDVTLYELRQGEWGVVYGMETSTHYNADYAWRSFHDAVIHALACSGFSLEIDE